MDRDPLVGTHLGEHYMIEACVGEGAIGRVYRARHRRLEHRVFAVKVMLGDWATTMSMRMRFAQEAETASRLDHPNVVPVIDFGRTEEGLLYLAMEYVEGRSLATVIDEDGPMSPGRTIALARQMCLGLSYAHAQGLVHRDFKPDNVLVVEAERGEIPRIADFGLAISEENDRDVRLTAVGIAVGTPAYAAPEQTSGDAAIDHRADLFSLGVTLFEMLAGKTPFDGNLIELIRHNARGNAPSIAERSGVVVPPALEQIVRTLMSPDPALRYPSAAAVIDALDRLDPATAVALVTLPVRQPRRMSWITRGLVASGVAAAGVIAAIALRTDVPPGSPPTTAPSIAPVVASVVAPPVNTPAPAAPPPVQGPVVTVAPTANPPREPEQGPSRPRSRLPVARSARVASGSADPVSARTPMVISVPVSPRVEAPSPVPDAVAPRPAPPPIALSPPAIEVNELSVTGSLPSSVVRRTIARVQPNIEACYARFAGALTADTLRMKLVIDEAGTVDQIQSAGGASASAATCIGDVLRRARSSATPDVGTVNVSFTLAMRRVPR